MHIPIFPFVVAALSVQQAASIPFNKRDASTNGMHINKHIFQNALMFTIFNLDTHILQFALTLEHIEVAFYTLALQQFSQSAFIEAGYTPLVFQRFVEIGQHEQTHVDLLTAALGDQAPQACNYSLCVFFWERGFRRGELILISFGIAQSPTFDLSSFLAKYSKTLVRYLSYICMEAHFNF